MRAERGSVIVIAAILAPLFIALGAIVVDVGDFFEHRRQLQTKADAAALAAGGRWTFPCSDATDGYIENEGRKYVGPHTQANGVVNTSSTLNEQVGGTPANDIHVVFNANEFWDDAQPEPADGQGITTTGTYPDYCDHEYVDVKVTEKDVSAFFGLFAPDVKAKARVRIEEAETLGGLLPIAVRIPEPQSVVAIFYNESTGNVLDVEYMRRVQPGIPVPSNLARWSNAGGFDLKNNPVASTPADFSMPPNRTGVVIATSFYPECDSSGNPPPPATSCLEDGGFAGGPVDNVCRQSGGNVARCLYATGNGSSQTVPYGLSMIRGYTNVGVPNFPPAVTAPPELESAWVESNTCQYGTTAGAYFNFAKVGCKVRVAAEVDVGGDRDGPGPFTVGNDVRVRLAGGACPENFNDNTPDCQLSLVGGSQVLWKNPGAGGPVLDETLGNGLKIRVDLRNTTVGANDCGGAFGQCRFEFPSVANSSPTNAVVRSFIGTGDGSGPIRFLRVLVDADNNGVADSLGEGQTNSQPTGSTPDWYVEMGLLGVIAQSQSDPPFAFDDKSNQSGALDCDPNWPNLKTEIQEGCDPIYIENDLSQTPPCPTNNPPQFFSNPSPPPVPAWPPINCVAVQNTSAFSQVLPGFNGRVFLDETNPTCPLDQPAGPNGSGWVFGRNYWHIDNNNDDYWTFPNINSNDPRLITLFLTGYDSNLTTGGENYPIVGFGQMYVTGWGEYKSGSGWNIEDPCPGNSPPADLDPDPGGNYVWGHLVNLPKGPLGGGSSTGEVCNPLEITVCVPVLVE